MIERERNQRNERVSSLTGIEVLAAFPVTGVYTIIAVIRWMTLTSILALKCVTLPCLFVSNQDLAVPIGICVLWANIKAISVHTLSDLERRRPSAQECNFICVQIPLPQTSLRLNLGFQYNHTNLSPISPHFRVGSQLYSARAGY